MILILVSVVETIIDKINESDWKDIIYWRICPVCQKEKFRKAILEWANYREGRLVIIAKCENCNDTS